MIHSGVRAGRAAVPEDELVLAFEERSVGMLEAAASRAEVRMMEVWKEDLPVLLGRVAARSGGPALRAAVFGGFIGERTEPNALAWAATRTAQLVVEIGTETRKAIRAVMQRAFLEYVPPVQSARLIRPLIGLTTRQATAVMNLRSALKANPGKIVYAGRVAISVPDFVTETFILAKTEAYAERLLRLRSMNIARTETMFASNSGLHQGWLNAAQSGTLDEQDLRKWITARSERTCEICRAMHGQTRSLREEFVLPDGTKVMNPPAHPSCRCGQGLAFEELKTAASGLGIPYKGGTPEYRREYARLKRKGKKPSTSVEDQISSLKPAHDFDVESAGTEPVRMNPLKQVGGGPEEDGTGEFWDTNNFISGLSMEGEDWKWSGKNGTVEEVALSSLSSAQSWIYPEKLKALHASGFDKSKPAAAVIRMPNGKDVIFDGNHRTTLLMMQGAEKIKVTRFNIQNMKTGKILRAAEAFEVEVPDGQTYTFSEHPSVIVGRAKDRKEEMRAAVSGLGIPYKGGTPEYRREYNRLKRKGARPPAAASKELTGHETQAIIDYQTNSGLINQRLRHPEKTKFPEATNEKLAVMQGHLDSSFAKQAGSTTEQVVYRGINDNFAKQLLKQGTVFEDKGYGSTTKSFDAARDFGNSMIKIHVPPGSKTLDMNSVLGKKSRHPEEKEVLLPRGTRFRVDHVAVKPATKTVTFSPGTPETRTITVTAILPKGLR